jgi:hypothetical protein
MRSILFSLPVLLLASAAQAQSAPPLEDASPHSQAAPDAEADLRAFQELFPNGAPSLLSAESFASQYRLPGRIKADTELKLPTKLDYADGPMKWHLESSVTTNPTQTTIIPGSSMPGAEAAGGTGNLKSRVTYSADQWELYGGRTVGVSQSDATGAMLQDSTVVGSLYKLPDWMSGGKVGTSFELLPTNERKTRVEYRQSFGPAEGFVAAEQTFAPHQTDVKAAPTTLRGGLSRKF